MSMKLMVRIRKTMVFCAALAALLLAFVYAQRRFSISMPGGPTLSFGGLRLSGNHRVEPCQMTSRNDAYQSENSAPAPVSNEPSAETVRGRALAEKGAQAFGAGRWAEAAGYLSQALALLPNDAAIAKTLTAAQVGIRMEEMAKRADEEKDRRAAGDVARVANDFDRLVESLDSLRHEACQSLIDRGDFEAAVNLPLRTDFVMDSSVVDLRQAREGVVNFEVLKPPKSVTGDVGFTRPVTATAARTETPQIRKVRQLFDDPAVEAVIFYERMGEAISYTPTEEERRDRFGDPVTRAVADSLGIDLGRASAADRALVERKTREIWGVYDKRTGERSATNAGIAHQSVQTFNAMMDRLRSQGLLKPGENLLAKEKSDPVFRDLVKSEVKAIVLEEEATRREADRNAFDKMLGDVAAILGGKGR